eukprot:COSAG01_NODE_160_length_23692_cov_9.703599_17_plen_71_part_00
MASWVACRSSAGWGVQRAGLVSWVGVVRWAGCQLSGAPRRLTWGVQRRRMSTDLRTVPSPEQGTSVSTRS